MLYICTVVLWYVTTGNKKLQFYDLLCVCTYVSCYCMNIMVSGLLNRLRQEVATLLLETAGAESLGITYISCSIIIHSLFLYFSLSE